MTSPSSIVLSVVIPVYNESPGLLTFHNLLQAVVGQVYPDKYEIIYCDDGSQDGTADIIKQLAKTNSRVSLIKLSRNFGKEIATTAGIHHARGQAIMTIDADGQHPVELIPQFITRWKAGSRVVIGLRTANTQEGLVKRLGSKLFYKIFTRLTRIQLIPGSTDFRLIDRTVQREFMRMTERNRITRGLIDWLGFERTFIEFTAKPRLAGEAGYSFKKLVKLAIDSMVSLSISPLYITAYIGAVVLPASVVGGLGMLINLLLNDPLHLQATGSAYVMILLLFLVGVLLVSQGIIGLYLSHIHTETQNRPLYIIDSDQAE
ncbi:MAG: glycosyltransferase family 2 protein [Candidatus Saccharibacteria bacterium]